MKMKQVYHFLRTRWFLGSAIKKFCFEFIYISYVVFSVQYIRKFYNSQFLCLTIYVIFLRFHFFCARWQNLKSLQTNFRSFFGHVELLHLRSHLVSIFSLWLALGPRMCGCIHSNHIFVFHHYFFTTKCIQYCNVLIFNVLCSLILNMANSAGVIRLYAKHHDNLQYLHLYNFLGVSCELMFQTKLDVTLLQQFLDRRQKHCLSVS